MKKTAFWLGLLAAFLFWNSAGYSGFCSAQSTTYVRGQPLVLFDGSSMEGWTKRDGTPSDGWIIQEGSLYRSKRAGDLYYKVWFQDFELSFRWKLEKGGNSGVKYRVQDYEKQSLGCEYQIQDDVEVDRHSAGGLYALYPPNKEKRKLNPPGQWNESKIIVCGQHIEHWLNGEQVVVAEVGSLDWLQRVAKSKFKDKQYFGQNRWGQIFLQDHGNPVWFQDIVITPLSATACDGRTHESFPVQLTRPLFCQPPNNRFYEFNRGCRIEPIIPSCCGF